jgi:hypothetical protein
MEFIEEAIRAHALGDPAIVAIINDRWHSVDLPERTAFPAVTMQQISGVPEHSHAGHSGLEHSRYQFTIWSDCHLKALRLAFAIERRFDAFRGRMGGDDGIEVGRSAKINRVNLGRDPGQKIHRTAIDFRISHQVDYGV